MRCAAPISKNTFLPNDGLKERGIEIYSFDPANIQPGDTVIAGLAFEDDHPELVQARAMDDVKVYRYNEFLGHLLESYNSICVDRLSWQIHHDWSARAHSFCVGTRPAI